MCFIYLAFVKHFKQRKNLVLLKFVKNITIFLHTEDDTTSSRHCPFKLKFPRSLLISMADLAEL